VPRQKWHDPGAGAGCLALAAIAVLVVMVILIAWTVARWLI
jgi:hypothetical protein